MSELSWIMSANVVIWIGLAAYAAFLALRQKDIDRRLRALELDRHV
jgi:CcmD family protein